jgi:hypothetical protein
MQNKQIYFSFIDDEEIAKLGKKGAPKGDNETAWKKKGVEGQLDLPFRKIISVPKYAVAVPFGDISRLDLFEEKMNYINCVILNRGSFGVIPKKGGFCYFIQDDGRYAEMNPREHDGLIRHLQITQREAVTKNLREHLIEIIAKHPLYGRLEIHPNEDVMEEALLINFLREQYLQEALKGYLPKKVKKLESSKSKFERKYRQRIA